ncbi:hypothetical protein TrLO_g5425 [Triparma laevis f. longispina]|uniref:Uncharacterized protein n=1 Tax=Triparma laevis f. longispina TaxID=1714387 RepID=A0A9W7DV68_9STRA|nr:hypothetical protein TrLO_g5425 [Triparma laevis f. longispina]
MGGKRGEEDEEDENNDEIIEPAALPNSTTSTQSPTAPAAVDEFMFTNDFRRLLAEFVSGDTLMTLKLTTKAWKAVAEKQLSDEEKLEMAILTVDGKDVSQSEAGSVVKSVRMWHVTQAIFLLNITKVGDYACTFAANLVVVDIPEGVERIGHNAFRHCYILTTVSFPTTLTCIAGFAFGNCSSLDNVDLLHTNLQELGREAFAICSELTSMTIPDSLQKLGRHVFHKCSKLFPSNIIVNDATNDTTPEVITHLRST